MELRDYLNVIRARKGIIIASALIVALTALAVSLIQPKMYAAEAKVLISEKDAGAALLGTLIPELSSQPERALQTQVQLVRIRPIAEATIRELNLQTSPEDLSKRVSVTAEGQTNIVTIYAEADSPAKAAKIATVMAEEFVAWSQDLRRRSLKEAADEVQRRLDIAQSQILDLGKKIQESGKTDQLSAELAIATGAYTTLAEKLETLRINQQLETGGATVVETAAVDTDPVSPQPVRNTVLGLGIGLVFGVGIAFLSEYLDNTIRSTDEAERVFGTAVLGTIPVDQVEKGDRRRLVILEAPGSAAAEAYRVLRNSLDFINFQGDMKTIVVTSAAPGEGKSTVSANLAAALANAGKKVVLVSSDFRRSTTQEFFKVNNFIGLSDVLLGAHSLKAALQRPGDAQLLVLTSGKMPPNPSELLGSSKMQEVIESLEEWADWVIIDTPPLLAVADPAAVARWADGVLLVSQAGVSTRDAARKASELLGKAGARIVGVVVWGLDEGRAGRYGYYGANQYYSHYYSSTTGKKGSDSGARAVPLGQEAAYQAQAWQPEPSGGQRAASLVGKIFAGFLAFLLVIAVAALVAYFLDQYFAWGLVDQLRAVLPL